MLKIFWDRHKEDISTCAELRTLTGEHCCVGSVVCRSCVIEATGVTLLKKSHDTWQAFKNGLESVAGKAHFQATTLLPFSRFPISPLLLRAYVDT